MTFASILLRVTSFIQHFGKPKVTATQCNASHKRCTPTQAVITMICRAIHSYISCYRCRTGKVPCLHTCSEYSNIIYLWKHNSPAGRPNRIVEQQSLQECTLRTRSGRAAQWAELRGNGFHRQLGPSALLYHGSWWNKSAPAAVSNQCRSYVAQHWFSKPHIKTSALRYVY